MCPSYEFENYHFKQYLPGAIDLTLYALVDVPLNNRTIFSYENIRRIEQYC